MMEKNLEPSDADEEVKPQSIIIPLIICLVGATIGFLEYLNLEHIGWPIAAEIFLHVGIAFLVAAILMSALEYRAKRLAHLELRQYRKTISKDVFMGVLGKIVPEEVFRQVNDILLSEIVRRNCKYRIFFKKPYEGMADDYFVIVREISYTVENLLGRMTTFKARSSHSEDLDPVAAGWGDRIFHLKLFIDGEEIPIVNEDNLFIEVGNHRLIQKIHLGPRQKRHVIIHGEEPCLIKAGVNSYLQMTPVAGIEVEVLNEIPGLIGDWKVSMNHPAANEAKPNYIGGYALDRAFLPGQGFQVTWKRVEAQK